MEQIGNYQLLQLVDEGSHGSLYKAVSQGTPFAVKLFNGDCPPAVLQEGKILSQLEHPNIVRYVAEDLKGDTPYLVMEWVEGTSLGKSPPPADFTSVLAVTAGVLRGLEAIHRGGWVHGDLKGDNILWGEGRVKLADFGLARPMTRGLARPMARPEGETAAGTLANLAPEILFGQPHRPAADLYALGVALYRWITGVFPFPTDSSQAVIRWHLFETPVFSLHALPWLPQEFADFILQLLNKNPADRPSSAGAALHGLRRSFPVPGDEAEAGDEAHEAESEDATFELYGAAIRYYEQKGSLSPEERLNLAELYYRQGYHEQAVGVAEPLESTAAELLRAKAWVRMGDFARAAERVRQLEMQAESLSPEERLAFLNVSGVLAFYQGHMESSQTYFRRAEAMAKDGGGVSPLSVSYNNLANVLLESGQEELAEQYFRRSVELARQAGDRIHEGMFHMSLGYFYHRKERFAEAMPCYDTGMEILKAVGQKSEMARVRFNRANLLLTLGDVSRAEADLTAAQQTFRQRSLHYLLSYSQLLEGDLARKKQDPGRALEIFAESYEGLSRLKRPVDACWAKLHQVECLLELGDAARAGTLLAEAEAFPPGADQPPAETQPMTDPKLRGHGSFLKARWHWSRGDSAEEVLTQFRVAEQSLQEAGDEEARILLHFAWGMFLAGRGSDEEMRRHLNEAQSGLMACAARLPEAWQRLYLKNSPYQEIQRRLKSMERMKLPLVEENRGAAETENFFERELKALQKEIVGELDLSALVERVLDRMIQLTEAERGFILLSETPTPRIVVSRNIEAEGGKKSKDQISWSIAQDVLAKGEALMTVDAMVDDRFSVTASIHQLKLRSILCLPFKKDGTVLGAIYLDSRRRSEAFRPSLVKALEPFAELIGQLLSNARRFFEVQASLKKARRELEAARAELKTKYDYRNIVGRHAKMLDVFKILDRVTDVEVPVLILGESGVGKELVAKAIHFNGPRGQRSFVSLNCQAIPEGLFESELFGHMRGAFTGALEDREGLVEQAHRGTLFLDEIGDMPLNLQGKLLRVLQEGKFRRVGDKQERPADCRLLAATHQDLRQLIAQGKFREDLYFRLDVVEAHLPPLRERMEDLPLLVDHFLGEFAVRHGGAKKQLSPSALALLARYRWPGNVRELENTVTNACVFAEGNLIGPEAFRYKRELSTFTPFPEEVDASVPPFEKGGTGGIFPHADDVRSLREGLQEYEKDLIRRAMEQARGNITRAAISLKVARPQLSRLIKKYKIKAV